MKNPPFRFFWSALVLVAFALSSPSHLHAEKSSDPTPALEGKKDPSRKKKAKSPDRPQAKPQTKSKQEQKKKPDCKKCDTPKATASGKGNCPKCSNCPKSKNTVTSNGKKAGATDCKKCRKPAPPAVAQKNPQPKREGHPPGPPPFVNRGDQQQRREKMRKRFEEMRKHGGPWVENHQWGDFRDHGNHRRSEHGCPRKQLAKTTQELEKARHSLHMAHKELGDKTVHIKNLEGQIQRYRAQFSRIGEGMKRVQKMQNDHKKLAEAFNAERHKSEALQNDIKVIQRKAKEAVAKIQATAKKHVEQANANAQRAMAATPKKSRKKSGITKKRTTSRAPKKPKPNKPAAPTGLTIAPIEYSPKSAVNYDERSRVLNDVVAVLKKSPTARIKITGHADDSAYEETNQDISTNRASFLAAFLRTNGIHSAKISDQGVGNTAPKKGSANNRRVVIEIVK